MHTAQCLSKKLSIMHYLAERDRASLRIMHTFDGTDARILLAMVENPAQTVVALAQQLGISRNTVQARLTTLEKHKAFLGFDRRVDPAALGYPLMAFITVHVQQQKLSQLSFSLADIPEIVEVHGLSGRADLLVRVVCTGAEDMFRINGKILACDGVERTETALAMDELVPYRLTPLFQRQLKE